MAEPKLETITPGDKIGAGCNGEVFSVEKHEPALVLKRFNSMSVDRRVLSEVYHNLAGLSDQDGLPEIHDSRFDSTPYEVLMERVNGTPLSGFSGLKETDAWTLIRTIADALGHAHKFGVVHGHLHDGNILVEKEKKGKLRPVVIDFGTGLLGEIHHIDIGETIYFAAPEQIESGGKDWEHGRAQQWDVYSFGVLAFLLINERHPRGLGYMKRLDKERSKSGGRPVPVDPAEFLEDIFDYPKYSWGMSLGLDKELKLYREIVDSCLELDPKDRPVDMREVRNRFRALDNRFALEDAESRVLKERRKQRAKLFGARAMAACLGAFFLVASYYLVEYLKKTYFFQNKVTELDQVVLTQKATITHLDERWAETVTDLKKSREAADSFFQKMARGDEAGGSGVASLKKADLEKSRDYYRKTLEDVAESEETAVERARSLHSMAHIERKMGIADESIDHFQSAIPAFEAILKRSDLDGETRADIHLRTADSYENVSSLLENPIGEEALAALENAVRHFSTLLKTSPNDLEIVMRQAGTNYKLGRAYDAHEQFEKAINAYSESAGHATALREKSPGDNESLTELIGKLQFSAASSLAKSGRIEEAIDAHVASMETIEQLRHVNGFSPLQSVQLASSFLELGSLFAKKDATTEDLDQLYNEALRLLTPLNTENPEDVEVAMLLCRTLEKLGHLERLEGRWSAGYRLSTRGIEALKEALGPEPEHIEGLLVLSETRLNHLKFLETEKEAASKIALKGVETAKEAESALEESNRPHEPILGQLRRRLGRVFQRYGEVCSELGENEASAYCKEAAQVSLAASETTK